ncbi:hypothetical protein MLD38_009554 [Melastoma candidum]|nr:hypothetical protein MLD38_009554 [Melastoma candidum]
MLPVEKAEESKIKTDSGDDEGFPPLEPNTNRPRPQQLEPDDYDPDLSSMYIRMCKMAHYLPVPRRDLANTKASSHFSITSQNGVNPIYDWKD